MTPRTGDGWPAWALPALAVLAVLSCVLVLLSMYVALDVARTALAAFGQTQQLTERLIGDATTAEDLAAVDESLRRDAEIGVAAASVVASTVAAVANVILSLVLLGVTTYYAAENRRLTREARAQNAG
jgi:hypothetical protein